MGIETILLKINNCRINLNVMYNIEIAKRDVEWNNKVIVLKNDYKNSLNDIQIGKFKKEPSAFKQNKNLIQDAFNENKITNVEYKNIKINQNLSIQREKHAIFYLVENGKIIFFTTKTSKSEKFQKPIKDEMLKNSVKEYITTSQLLKNKEAYLSNSVYVLEFKTESELTNVIKNDKSNLTYYFKDKDLIIIQKEKAFELFYRNILKKEPEILLSNTFEELNNVVTNQNGALVDVTFDNYVKDNIDRISNYENQLADSWMSYLKLYEIDDDIKSKNDPSDI